MDHVAACPACAEFWRELQAAQALAVRLPRHRVGAEFREQLFDRIQAGEGTPPAVFQEAVPFAAKIRYTLTGAAAAAAVLVAATLVQRESPDAPTTDPRASTPLASTPQLSATAAITASGHSARALTGNQPAPSAQLAGNTPYTASENMRPLAPRTQETTAAESLFGAVRPLTPDVIAVETAREFEQNYRWTSQLLDRGQVDDATARTVCSNAAEIRNLGRMLVDLRDSKWLSFANPEVDADLRVVVALLDAERLRGMANAETVRTMIAPALRKSASLAQLTDSLSVSPKFDRDDQQFEVMRFSRSHPEGLERIFLFLPNQGEATTFDPRDVGRTFVIQDNCGPIFVAPFREVRRLRSR